MTHQQFDNIIENKALFNAKMLKLQHAQELLKSEYFGIDQVIDDILENVRSWYILPDLQERPAIINLWGLTGTGKTSLVIRLMELLEFSDKTYRFDLGDKSESRSFSSTISDLCENSDESPLVLILDEFHQARTLRGQNLEEVENDQNRMIWELIDSGKISYNEWSYELISLESMTRKMMNLVNSGVRVENGLVLEKKELFIHEMELTCSEEDALPFIDKDQYSAIINLAGDYFKIQLKHDLEQKLMQMNGSESLKFLSKVIINGSKPKTKSFAKAIIFVIGNIDEAYAMSNNYNADISADEFYEISLKINVPDIKQALRQRFRNEQIARLGNIHIIYPALKKSAYESIIHRELNRIQSNIQALTGIVVNFDDTVAQELYKEGVYPNQGARPIFTTIYQMVQSKIGLFIQTQLEEDVASDSLNLTVRDGHLVCDYVKNNAIIREFSTPISYNLENLRKSKHDEMQAISAVHEAGHALLSIALFGQIPETVYSITSQSHSAGFVYIRSDAEFIARNQIIPRIAVLLGGIVAEEIIFGQEFLSSGGDSDIQKATEMIMSLYKKSGFGKRPIKYAQSENEDELVYHDIDEIEREIEHLIDAGKKLAIENLNAEKKLFLAIAEQLATIPKLDKTEIEALINEHATQKLNGLFSSDYYRNALSVAIKNQLYNKDNSV
jgi:cell division protease FtsH